MTKKTFIVDIDTDKKLFNEWMEELVAKARAEAIDECAEIMASIHNFCRICLIDCDWGTESSCKERWAMYLGEKLKEKK